MLFNHVIVSGHSRTPLTQADIDTALEECLNLQNSGVDIHGKRPFAALLLGHDNKTVLLTHLSISHIQHAEAELARLASIHYSQSYLWECTLVSTWEPCAMCTGTLYWSNIGRLLYAASEERLNKLTGSGNDENMTMSLPCRTVLEHGQKKIEVLGPVQGWQEKVVKESEKWWRQHNSGPKNEGESLKNAAESFISTQDPDGEYEAQLDIDWLR